MDNDIELYLTWLEHNKGRSARTVDKYRQQLERLQGFLASRNLSLYQATLDDLNEFAGLYAHQELKLTASARRPLVAAVRGFYAWARKTKRTGEDLGLGMEYPKSGRKIPVAMSLASAEKILLQCDLETFIGLRDAAILAVLVGCGPRVSGVCRLNIEDLLWTRDEAHQERLIIRFKEKGDKERLVPAPTETALYLRAYLSHEYLATLDRTLEDGDQVLFVSHNHQVPAHERLGDNIRIAPRSVYDRIRKYGEETGIPAAELHPHAIRHLFGAEFAEEEVNPFVQAELMGHEDTNTTHGYTRLAIRKKAEAIDLASPIKKIKTPVSQLARDLEQSQRKRL